MSEVIPFVKPAPQEPKCGFCGVVKSKSNGMIQSSTGAAICKACILKAKERLNDG